MAKERDDDGTGRRGKGEARPRTSDGITCIDALDVRVSPRSKACAVGHEIGFRAELNAQPTRTKLRRKPK